MNVVIFNWRDLEHPRAGGAEYYTHSLASGLAARGHAVTLVTSRPRGAPAHSERDGYTILRRGSALTCRLFAAAWLFRNRRAVDAVVDEVNTLPWLSPLIAPGRVTLLIHQLAREIWFAESPLPVAIVGYLIEPLFLQIYRRVPVVTISASSAETLVKIGLRGRISVVECPLAPAVNGTAPEFDSGSIGYVGRITRSKRIDHLIRALAIVRRAVPNARLAIVGNGSPRQVEALLRLARRCAVADAVTFSGRLSDEERDGSLARFEVLALASMREGWGLVVSEAARFGVPSVVYPVPGLVDAVQDGETGIVSPRATPNSLAAGLVAILTDRALRARLGSGAAAYLELFTFERFISRFETILRRDR
jgi:glycosyltransferase involved in cell wall biosynthesis